MMMSFMLRQQQEQEKLGHQQQQQRLDRDGSSSTMATTIESAGGSLQYDDDDENDSPSAVIFTKASSIPVASITSANVKVPTYGINNHDATTKLSTTSEKLEKGRRKLGQQRIKKKSNKLMTPCSTIKAIRKSYVRRTEDNYKMELIQLCRKRYKMTHEHLSTKTTLYPTIERILQNSPTIIHSCIDPTSNYNLLQLVCTNPTLANDMYIMKLFIETSRQVTNQERMKEEMKAMKKKFRGRRNNDRDNSRSNVSKASRSNIPKLMLTRTMNHETILHLVCSKYPNTNISFDTMEYLIKSYPKSLTMKDAYHDNIPFHCLCASASVTVVPFEIILLLVHHYPECYKVANGDGNLPLHLLCNITSNITSHRTRQVKLVIEPFVDSLADINFDFGGDDHDQSDNADGDARDQEYDRFDDDDAIDMPNQPEFRKRTSSVYTQNIIVPSLLPQSEQERLEQEYQEKLRYEKQLELIEYIVALYPDALHARNDDGLTPAQVAMTTSSKQKQLIQKSRKHMKSLRDFEQSSHSGEKYNDYDDDDDDDQMYPWNKIIDFLRNPNIEKSSNIVEGFADYNQNHGSNNRLQDDRVMGFSDHGGKLSGRELEDPLLLLEQSPWTGGSSRLMTDRINKLVDNCLLIDVMDASNNHNNALERSLSTQLTKSNEDDPLLYALQALRDASERDSYSSPARYRTRINRFGFNSHGSDSLLLGSLAPAAVMTTIDEGEDRDHVQVLELSESSHTEQHEEQEDEQQMQQIPKNDNVSPKTVLSSTSTSSKSMDSGSSFANASTVVVPNQKDGCYEGNIQHHLAVDSLIGEMRRRSSSSNPPKSATSSSSSSTRNVVPNIEMHDNTFHTTSTRNSNALLYVGDEQQSNMMEVSSLLSSSFNSEDVVISSIRDPKSDVMVTRSSSKRTKRRDQQHASEPKAMTEVSSPMSNSCNSEDVVVSPIRNSKSNVPVNRLLSKSISPTKRQQQHRISEPKDWMKASSPVSNSCDSEEVVISPIRNTKSNVPVNRSISKSMQPMKRQEQQLKSLSNDMRMSSDHNSSFTKSSCSTSQSSKLYYVPLPEPTWEFSGQLSMSYLNFGKVKERSDNGTQLDPTQHEYWPIVPLPSGTGNNKQDEVNEFSSRGADSVRRSKQISMVKSALKLDRSHRGPDNMNSSSKHEDFHARVYVPKQSITRQRSTDPRSKHGSKKDEGCDPSLSASNCTSEAMHCVTQRPLSKKTRKVRKSKKRAIKQGTNLIDLDDDGFVRKTGSNLIDFDDDGYGYTKSCTYDGRNLIDLDELSIDNSCISKLSF